MRADRRTLVTIGLAASAAIGACGCGQTVIPEVPVSAVPSPSVAAPTPSPAATGTLESPGPSTTADATLLDHLPASIDEVERRPDLETAGSIADDAALGAVLESVAVALYAAEDDYAVATIARLRPGVFGDAWFRDWRDSFDAGVCEQAGGVDAGRSELPLGGRTVYRSTCVGGVVIHHVHLPGSDLVVSIQGAGERDLGRQIAAGLKE